METHEQSWCRLRGRKYFRFGQACRFEGEYDLVTWECIRDTPQGTLVLLKRTRSAFGSKVVVDTWMEQINTPTKGDQ